MQLKAFAKINWDLHILGRRPDGFHELDSVMVTIGLADELTIEEADEFSFSCSDSSLPTDDKNLAVKAARQLAEFLGKELKVKIHLAKKIPWGGGLGGGSSDAASVLIGLNQLWQQACKKEQLSIIAAEIGSDVPYFLDGGWCRIRGRGEIVEPLSAINNLPDLNLLLISPSIEVSTPMVYGALNAPEINSEQLQHRTLTEVAEMTTIHLSNINEGKYFNQPFARNDLEPSAQKTAPVLQSIQSTLEEILPNRWRMSGSGAVHFIPVTNKSEGEALQKELQSALRAEKMGIESKIILTSTRNQIS